MSHIKSRVYFDIYLRKIIKNTFTYQHRNAGNQQRRKCPLSPVLSVWKTHGTLKTDSRFTDESCEAFATGLHRNIEHA